MHSLPSDRPGAPRFWRSTPAKRYQLQQGRGHFPVFLFLFLPLLRESSERTTELGSVGETSLKIFVSCNFLVSFQVKEGCKLPLYQEFLSENIPSALRLWELKGEREVRGRERAGS